MTTVNAVDIVVIVVLLASGVFALMRGFVHEVLAMAGWIIAPLLAFWSLPMVRPIAGRYITNQTFADIAGGGAVLLLALLVLSVVTSAVSRTVQKSAVSSVDRSLGFAFGLARGLALVSLAFMVSNWLMPDEPEMLAQAKMRPLLVFGARTIQSLVPQQVSHAQDKTKEAADALTEAQQAKEMYDRLQAPKPRSPDSNQNDAKQAPSYDKHGLERLIETTK